VKDLIDSVIAQEFDAPDLEFAWSADPSVDPQQQEAILSSYTSKGILTINETRAALGRDPLAEPAANKPMALTGAGYVPLGQAAQATSNAAGQVAKFNNIMTNADGSQRTDGAGSAAGHSAKERVQVAETERDKAPVNFTSPPAPADGQQALISCDDLLESDWATCNSVLISGSPVSQIMCRRDG
jgi:hypothetical protein